MISIIVCSYNSNYFNNFVQNVAQTINVPYEIIRIDNSAGNYSVCKAYNEGISKAAFDLLCFSHEDIEIKTKGWGTIVSDTFSNDEKTGLIGVAGASYKTFAPSTWTFGSAEPQTNHINILQRYKHQSKPVKHIYLNHGNEKLSQVVAVDGVWFCTKKAIAQEVLFDEVSFKGYHGYDIDFSLGVLRKYNVVVSFEILVEHFSEGKYDRFWIEDMLIFQKKWGNKLPVNLRQISREMQRLEEIKAFGEFVNNMYDVGYKSSDVLNKLTFKNPRLPISPADKMQIRFLIYKEASKRTTKKIVAKLKMLLKKAF
jgi:hypothetical protein